jgi:hypothetical protein
LFKPLPVVIYSSDRFLEVHAMDGEHYLEILMSAINGSQGLTAVSKK